MKLKRHPTRRAGSERRKRALGKVKRPKEPRVTGEEVKEYVLDAAGRDELPMMWPLKAQVLDVVQRAGFMSVRLREVEPKSVYSFTASSPLAAIVSEKTIKSRLRGRLKGRNWLLEPDGLDMSFNGQKVRALIRFKKPVRRA